MNDRPRRFETQELVANRYRLLTPIDRTGFGEAWSARDESMARLVEVHDLGTLRGAILPQEAAATLRALAAVKHRALAATQDILTLVGGVAAVVAPTDGVPLATWIEERARAGTAARLEATRAVMDQAAQGLWTLHRTPAVPPLAHGCFGAPCVRVEMRGTQPVVRLEAQGWGQVAVPPGWWVCPPEGEAQTPTADVFALGLLATALLTGGSTVHHGEAVRRRFQEHLPEADATLVDAIAACVAADPASRPADARAARERLLQTSTSWRPRERPIAVAPRAPAAEREVEPPAQVHLPVRVRQVWLVPVEASKPSLGSPTPEADATYIDEPRPRARQPPAARVQPVAHMQSAAHVQPLVQADDATAAEATLVSPAPRPEADAHATGGGRLEAPRDDTVDSTLVIPAPQDEPTEIAPPRFEEQTCRLGDHVRTFGPMGGPGDHTLGPGVRGSGTVAVAPEAATLPMSAASASRAKATGPLPVPAPREAAMGATTPHAVAPPRALAALVVAAAITGGLLGLVFWWAIR